MENKDKSIHPTTKEHFDNQPHLSEPQIGLTKREYFSGLAMQGIIANSYNNCEGSFPENLCKDAVTLADELLKQLEHGNK